MWFCSRQSRKRNGAKVAMARGSAERPLAAGAALLAGLAACGSMALAVPAKAHEASAAAALAKFQPGPAAVRPAKASASPATATVRVEVRDAATGEPAPANVRVYLKESGQVFTPADPRTATGLYRTPEWYTLEAADELELPAEPVRIEAFRGIEWSLTQTELDLSAGGRHRVRLEVSRFHDLAGQQWISGNTHLHLQQTDRGYADRYLRAVPLADDVRVLFVSYLERAGDDWHYASNLYRPADLAALGGGAATLRFGWGQETRHNFGEFGEGYGHALLLDLDELIEPVSIGPGIMGAGSTDGTPLLAAIKQAQEAGATVIWAHNDFGHEDVPNWLAGRVHAQNIFDGGDATHYAASFYRYLDLGMKVPFSTGTDWFMTDLSRVVAQLEGELDIPSWLRALRAGRSFITNGPMLHLNAGGQAIGGTIEARRGEAVQVAAGAIGRTDFRKLELIHNGRVVHAAATRRAGPAFKAEIDFPLTIEQPGWLAVRVPWHNNRNLLGKVLRAHTSPIYLEVNGQRRFDLNTARGFIEEMRASMQVISDKGVFADEGEEQAVLGVYEQAIDRLSRRLMAASGGQP